MAFEPLKDRANGQWRGILPALGIGAKYLVNKHGPCPICGGKDRFRFDDKNGTGSFFCNSCGAGDGIEFVKKFKGVEFKEAAELIEQHIGAAPPPAMNGRQRQDDGQQREKMRRLWEQTVPIGGADPVGLYLLGRCGLTAFPEKLRFKADLRYDGKSPSYHPAMVAKVDPSDAAAANGERAALHRTYLDRNGHKAALDPARKMLGQMPSGAAVRLAPVSEDGTLGIAEGIETALSATALHKVPCWAALTAGLLETWEPPADVRCVFVFGDNDESYTGQKAAYALANRLRGKGLEVYVEIPTVSRCDWNDMHMKQMESAA